MRGLNLKEIMFKSNMNQQGLNIATYRQAYPACSSWLNFRVRGQFEIKILIVRHINTTYFI